MKKKFSEFSKSIRGKDNKYKLPAIETVFGSHSKNKTNIKEDLNYLSEDNESDREKIRGVKVLSTEDDPHFHILEYTQGSRGINKHLHNLHNGVPVGDYIKKKFREQSKSISSALKPTTKDTVLYTGVRRSPADAWGKNDDKTKPIKAHLPAFTSTSHDYESTKQFALPRSHNLEHHPLKNDEIVNDSQRTLIKNSEPRHIMKIYAPAGTRAGYLENISPNPEEKETLLDRGHDVEIHPNPSYSPRDHTLIWHAKIVGHNPQPLNQPLGTKMKKTFSQLINKFKR